MLSLFSPENSVPSIPESSRKGNWVESILAKPMNRGRGSNRGRAGGSRRGASRGRGRGRGGGRGGKPSGRGRSEVRSFTEQKHDERKITFEEDAKDSGIDMDNEVDDEKQESGDENDGEIDLDNAAPLAYNALLTLLADDPEEKPRKKRRKTGHAQEAGTGTEPDTQDDIGDLPEPEDQEEPTDEIDEAGIGSGRMDSS